MAGSKPRKEVSASSNAHVETSVRHCIQVASDHARFLCHTREIQMHRLVASFLACAIFSSAAQATPILSVEIISCTGTQTTAISDVLSIGCTGDLSLLGGSISAESQILLSSGGALALDNLALAAPDIHLSGASVSLGAGVAITTNTFAAGVTAGPYLPSISAGSTISIGGSEPRPIVIGNILLPPGGLESITSGDSGGPITIMPSVPEPSAYASMLIGILVLAAGLRKRGARMASPGNR